MAKITLLNRLRARLLGAPNPEETGEENARRFVAVISRLAMDERVITAYPHPAWKRYEQERAGWVWMLNPKWRARVMELLENAPVKEATFHQPDSIDGWTFSAYSTVPVPRIAKLELTDKF